uniref:PLAC8 family protein n=1 Tax=Guillardia theta TaxID=55529 RepID=A0A7S4L2A2_GUITH|mmetsp:Transcript_35819/g.112063  ORF Transcript_35819/g.112063 Transcript_35819/m.112063 type:complete len:495 (+) Transcript_35819:200-1684(+)
MKTISSGGEFQQVPYSDGLVYNTRTKKTTHEQAFFKLGGKSPPAPNIRLICHDVFEGNDKREIVISGDMTWSDTLNVLHESYGRPTVFEYQNQFYKMERVDDEDKFLKFCILLENSALHNKEPSREVFVRFWDKKPATVQSPSDQMKNSMSGPVDTGEPWSSGLFSCSGGFLDLLQACFCPCLPYAAISASLGQSYRSSCLCRVFGSSPMTLLLRQKFRRTHQISERNSHDIVASCCCEPCALVQMQRHLKEKGSDDTNGKEDEESASHAWEAPLCCDIRDSQSCIRWLTACFCSPCVFGRVRNIMLQGDEKKINRTSCLLYFCCMCSPMLYGMIGGASRTQLRLDRSLSGSPCSDCLLHTFCSSCALYQEAVTVGIWPKRATSKKPKGQKSRKKDKAEEGEEEQEQEQEEVQEKGEKKQEDKEEKKEDGGEKGQGKEEQKGEDGKEEDKDGNVDRDAEGGEAGGVGDDSDRQEGEEAKKKAEQAPIDPDNIAV